MEATELNAALLEILSQLRSANAEYQRSREQRLARTRLQAAPRTPLQLRPTPQVDLVNELRLLRAEFAVLCDELMNE